MTEAERRKALDQVAAEIRVCTKCRLHEGRTNAVPGEGDPETEVVFVGEGPGFNEDRQGRPFVGRAGELLVGLLASIGWRRDEVFITNVVKCRPPDNRDPQPDEIAACWPYLERQLKILEPAVVVTLGRHSLGRFQPGARIGQVHGTARPADAAAGAAGGTPVFAMYHPAAALRTPDIERHSFEDVRGIPFALLEARRRRSEMAAPPGVAAERSGEVDGSSGAIDVPSGEAASPGADLRPTADRPEPSPAPTASVAADPPPTQPPPGPAAEPDPQLTMF